MPSCLSTYLSYSLSICSLQSLLLNFHHHSIFLTFINVFLCAFLSVQLSIFLFHYILTFPVLIYLTRELTLCPFFNFTTIIWIMATESFIHTTLFLSISTSLTVRTYIFEEGLVLRGWGCSLLHGGYLVELCPALCWDWVADQWRLLHQTLTTCNVVRGY